MRAMLLKKFAPIEQSPLELTECAPPEPHEGELLLKVDVCGVCRTDLHLVEGELLHAKLPIIPGHQIIGDVVKISGPVGNFQIGDRVGVAWLYETCGQCEFCRSGRENLCREARFTSYDVDGGFAEFATVPAAFAYRINRNIPAENAAPLLCAGIVGYRALRFACEDETKHLGIIGFGASAHIVIQVARFWGCDVYVFSRAKEHLAHARRLGAVWTGDLEDDPPVKLQSIIDFAPAGATVPAALEKLDRGGRLILAGIHMSPVPTLNYEKHLYHERQIRSVMAATRRDGQELLDLAAEIPINTDVEVFDLADANTALQRLKASQLKGSAVLTRISRIT